MENPETVEALRGERARVVEGRERPKKKASLLTRMKRQWLLYAMVLPAVLILAVLRVSPLWGIAIAFFDYHPALGLTRSEFVGLENFQQQFCPPVQPAVGEHARQGQNADGLPSAVRDPDAASRTSAA